MLGAGGGGGGVNVGSSSRALVKGGGSVPVRSTEKRVGQERVVIVFPYIQSTESRPISASIPGLIKDWGLACPDSLKIGG